MKEKKKVLHRSSKSGKIVTEEFADHHPATTQEETVTPKIACIDESFGGNMDTLKDKINELINHING